MLITDARSCLLIVDMQERLVPVIHGVEEQLQHIQWLLQIARRLHVPVLASEQYPQGLGPTVTPLREQLAPDECLEKIHFACTADDSCATHLRALDRDQWVVVGAESHVCVLQTVLGLRGWGHEVYVVAEGVGSRRPADRQLALARMAQAGATLVSREMVAFEWLHRAGTEHFREISREFLR